MLQTRWAIDSEDDAGVIELNGHKYSSGDEGAPMLCSLVCTTLARHIHFDYCRAREGELCRGEGVQHVRHQVYPDPEAPKDVITHELYWKRAGGTAFRNMTCKLLRPRV